MRWVVWVISESREGGRWRMWEGRREVRIGERGGVAEADVCGATDGIVNARGNADGMQYNGLRKGKLAQTTVTKRARREEQE